ESSARLDLGRTYSEMWGALALALVAGLVAAFGPVEVRAVAALFVALWVLSPAVARWISRPVATRPPDELDADARQRIAATTRRSWRFCETFVTADANWLPPDHLQRHPRPA